MYWIYRAIIYTVQPPAALVLAQYLNAIEPFMLAMDDCGWHRVFESKVRTEWIKGRSTFSVERM